MKKNNNLNNAAANTNNMNGGFIMASMDMKQSLEYTEYRYKQIENRLLRIWEKIA